MVFNCETKVAQTFELRKETYGRVMVLYPNSILVHDCEEGYRLPFIDHQAASFIISSPNEDQYAKWAKQVGASKKYVDLWSDAEFPARTFPGTIELFGGVRHCVIANIALVAIAAILLFQLWRYILRKLPSAYFRLPIEDPPFPTASPTRTIPPTPVAPTSHSPTSSSPSNSSLHPIFSIAD